MVEGSIERRLAAIVVADVVGYSKLINADEAGTHARFRELQNDLFEPTVQSHGGRVIKTMGDAFLLEFPSAVEAVACATKIQNILPELEADRPDDQRIIFRIGINVGDIIVDGDDIHGDGVIVASRLEAIADAGGILISDDTYRQVRDRLDISVDDQGEVDVKNIDRPVRVFRVLGDGEEKKAPAHVTTPRWKNSASAAVVVLVAIIGGSTWWWLQRLDFVPADPSKFAYKLPDKPSIAVMPFANLSGDSGQDFLADGIVDSIITALARTEQLFVIGRNSTFSFKGKPFIVKEVAEKFGVRHVLEGSFQKTKETIRITARLIDALSGRQIWGGTFDRKTSDILALQDDITAKVVEELQVKLTVGEQGRVWRRETKNPEAYQLMLKARDFWYRFTPEDILKARAFAEQALALDPSFGSAEGWRARTFYLEFYNGWARDPALAYSKSIKSLEKALAMGNSPAWLHMQSAYILLQSGEREKAFAETEKGLTLQPGAAAVALTYAEVLVMDGRRPEEVLRWLNRAQRLSPNLAPWEYWPKSEALRQLGRYDEMIEVASRILNKHPDFWWAHPRLVFAYMKLGREEEARAQLKQWLTGHPERVQAFLGGTKTFPKPMYDEYVRTLVKAGFPDPGKSED